MFSNTSGTQGKHVSLASVLALMVCTHEVYRVLFLNTCLFTSLCRSSPTSGRGWMTPSCCASCGPGSLTTTVPCSCCSTTTRVGKPGPKSSRTWSRPQWSTSWTWASSQCCHSPTPAGDTSSVYAQVLRLYVTSVKQPLVTWVTFVYIWHLSKMSFCYLYQRCFLMINE